MAQRRDLRSHRHYVERMSSEAATPVPAEIDFTPAGRTTPVRLVTDVVEQPRAADEGS